MKNEKKFKTKTGFCSITPDQITLKRRGVKGEMAKLAVGNYVGPILFFYGAISIALMYIAFDYYQKGESFTSLFLVTMGLWLFYGMIASLNNSVTPIINRNKIRRVRFIKPVLGLTRARFEVFFEDSNGKIKKRLILLPGLVSGGQKEIPIALQIMRDEKLL